VKKVVKVELPEKSRKFIEDLRHYLFSSGRNDQEIKEIAEELEDHFYEAERNGKSIDQIIGASPKEYMESISIEMKVDYRAWAKYIPLIFWGAVSFSVIGDLLQGTLSYSLLTILGTFLNCCLFLAGVFIAFRFTAKYQISKVREFLIILIPIFMSMLFTGGVLLADSIYPTPIVHFGILGSILISLFLLGFIVLFSIWAKTAVLPVILIALILPTELLAFTSFNEVTQLTFGLMLTYLLIGGYLLYVMRKEKRKVC
jgi:DNA-binding ferritin-like protein (Dps family)